MVGPLVVRACMKLDFHLGTICNHHHMHHRIRILRVLILLIIKHPHFMEEGKGSEIGSNRQFIKHMLLQFIKQIMMDYFHLEEKLALLQIT